MNILKADLGSAVSAGIIDDVQADKLWLHFESLRPDQSRFQGLHVIYYFGGVLILASMSWFLTLAWNDGLAIMMISGLFALLYMVAGNSLWKKQNLKIPGGLLITAAVGLTPVFVYGFQSFTGMWTVTDLYGGYHQYVRGQWFFMEGATIAAGLSALRFYKFPFLTFPVAVTLWYMSMDLTPLLFGKADFTWDDRKLVSCIFGLIMLAASFHIDRRFKDDDFAFWTYLYGLLAFWGGLSLMDSDSELGKFIYCLLNVGFMIVAVFLRRRVFAIFGTLGVLIYLSHLTYKVFQDSFTFPIAVALLGICILFLGVQYQKNKKSVEAFVESLLPTILKKWRPEERA